MNGITLCKELNGMTEEEKSEMDTIVFDRNSVVEVLQEFNDGEISDNEFEKCAEAIGNKDVFSTSEIQEIINEALYGDHEVETALYQFLDKMAESMKKPLAKKLAEKKIINLEA